MINLLDFLATSNFSFETRAATPQFFTLQKWYYFHEDSKMMKGLLALNFMGKMD
jgi:hypothetical protein